MVPGCCTISLFDNDRLTAVCVTLRAQSVGLGLGRLVLGQALPRATDRSLPYFCLDRAAIGGLVLMFVLDSSARCRVFHGLQRIAQSNLQGSIAMYWG